MSSPTASFLKDRAAYNSSIVTGKWQSNFYASYTYAIDNGLPFIAVWSNGDACGNCVTFEDACSHKSFKTWMSSSGIVFYFCNSGDRGNGNTVRSATQGMDDGKIPPRAKERDTTIVYNWCRITVTTKKMIGGYPYIHIYWPKGGVDHVTTGQNVDDSKDGKDGAEFAISYFKKALKNFKPGSSSETPEITDQIAILVNALSKWPEPSASQKFVNYVRGYTDGYTGQTTTVTTVSASIVNSHCFGLNHDVLLYGNDNLTAAVEYKDDGKGGVPSIIYNQTVQVDHYTVDDFRYGQWYYNAQQLKAFADAHHIPVLIEIGSKNCGPCEDFLADVYNNSTFQSTLASKNILLCKITSSDDFATGQERFITKEWLPIPPRRDYVMPVLALYWNQGKTSTDGYGNMIDNIYLAFAHYNKDDQTSYPDCPLLTDLETTLAWLNEKFEDSGMNASYSPDPRFYRPSIIDSTSGYPRYKMYDNQSNDTYGRYFPVAHLEPPNQYDTFTISVNNEYQALTQYTIEGNLYAASLPPQGTYQYFTALSTSANAASYELEYDLSGIIFKVDVANRNAFYKSQPFTYGSKTVLQLLKDLGIANASGSLVAGASCTSSFYDDAYIINTSTTPPTVQIDDDFFDNPSQPRYNCTATYSIPGGVDNDGKKLTQLRVSISSNVEVVKDEDDDYDVQPTGDIYAISASFFSTDFSQSRVAWLSVFSNV